MDKTADAIKLSIIVPIYGVEKYLRQCLDSIVAQTFNDFECILVDDGSKDGCPAICDEYAAKDPRFTVIHKKNAGYGAAVNTGLDLAHGEWIGIVEPDDWIEPDMYGSLMGKIEDGVDVVKGNYQSFLGDVTKPNPYKATERMLRGIFRLGDCPQFLYWHPSIWTCIYRRRFIEHSGIRMLEAPGAVWNDNPWQVQTLFAAKGIKFIDSAIYHYRNHCAHAYEELKDYRLPICRDMDSLEWLQHQNSCPTRIFAAFYHRIWTHLSSLPIVTPLYKLRNLHRELFALFRKFDTAILQDPKLFDNENVRQEIISWREHLWWRILRIRFAPRRIASLIKRCIVK